MKHSELALKIEYFNTQLRRLSECIRLDIQYKD
jgi:hypothetical protein